MYEQSGVTELEYVAGQVVYQMALNRGRAISDVLAQTWHAHQGYKDARRFVDEAVAHDQIIGGVESISGVNVMTMHKSKGKEFDAVILLHLANISPFCSSQEPAPYMKSRRLLRVAITRARHQVLLLTDGYNPSPLLAGHYL